MSSNPPFSAIVFSFKAQNFFMYIDTGGPYTFMTSWCDMPQNEGDIWKSVKFHFGDNLVLLLVYIRDSLPEKKAFTNFLENSAIFIISMSVYLGWKYDKMDTWNVYLKGSSRLRDSLYMEWRWIRYFIRFEDVDISIHNIWILKGNRCNVTVWRLRIKLTRKFLQNSSSVWQTSPLIFFF